MELKDLVCYSPSKDSMHVPLESVKCQQREPAREVKVVDRPYLEGLWICGVTASLLVGVTNQ